MNSSSILRVIISFAALFTIVLLAVGGVQEDNWGEPASVFEVKDINGLGHIITNKAIGVQDEFAAMGTIVEGDLSHSTAWVFWGDSKELIGKELRIKAKKRGTKELINATPFTMVLEEGIWGADAYAYSIIHLREVGEWKLFLYLDGKPYGEMNIEVKEL